MAQRNPKNFMVSWNPYISSFGVLICTSRGRENHSRVRPPTYVKRFITNFGFRSIIIDHLESAFKDQSDVGIAYIYCNYKEEAQTSVHLVGSLLHQLVQRHSNPSNEIHSLYKSHFSKRTHPTLSEYSTLLQSECRSFSKVVIVIDALDEC